MVLKIAEAAVAWFFPTQYTVHIAIALLTVLLLRAFSQGRRTTRERDLHARTIIVTGGFTPLGLTILNELANRGAHIIALSSHPITDPRTSIIIDLLRTTTSNEHIFAEHCPLSSPSAIRAFCTKFLKGEDTRVDSLVLAHEYRHVGALGFLERKGKGVEEKRQKERQAGAMATFLLTTLLLPALLVAPVERDIRIVQLVNPFYAAAASSPFAPSLLPMSPSPSPSPSPSHSPSATPTRQPPSPFLLEGARALRSIILTRHLQRILDALPAAQVPKTDLDMGSAVPVVSSKAQKSNIVAVSVSPGISRLDTLAGVLNADWTREEGGCSWFGVVLYFLLQPLLRIFTKSPSAAVQSVLHALFLPTPFKVLAQTSFSSSSPSSANLGQDGKRKPPPAPETDMPEEVLKPGALYGECAVVRLRVPVPEEDPSTSSAPSSKLDTTAKADTKDKSKSAPPSEQDPLHIPLDDDGEYGGEHAGRVVWEGYEMALRRWEEENPEPFVEEKADSVEKEKGTEKTEKVKEKANEGEPEAYPY